MAVAEEGLGSVSAVVAAQARGERVKFLHFWGHRARADGAVSALFQPVVACAVRRGGDGLSELPSIS